MSNLKNNPSPKMWKVLSLLLEALSTFSFELQDALPLRGRYKSSLQSLQKQMDAFQRLYLKSVRKEERELAKAYLAFESARLLAVILNEVAKEDEEDHNFIPEAWLNEEYWTEKTGYSEEDLDELSKTTHE